MSIELDELVSLDAAGALSAEEQRSLRARLASAPPAERAAAAQIYDLAAEIAIAGGGDTGVTGPVFRPALRARIMAQLSRPVRFSVTTAEGQWVPTPIPGVTMKVLSLDRDRDAAVLLVRGEPGARYPAHHHTRAEECYVISGEVLIHGQTHRAGDFHHAEPDTDHDELYTPTGVEVLLVVAASDYGL